MSEVEASRNGSQDLARPIIRARDLTFCYPGRDAPTLEHIDLEVHAGELVLLTGSTGSGKSTLLKCLAGIVPHMSAGTLSGEVDVDGLPIRENPPRALSRHLGMVLQNPDAQLCATRVEDELAFGLENLRLHTAEIDRRIEWALEQVGLSSRRGDEIRILSGGQKQRLVIAAALAMGPRILLLDEPVSQLDPVGSRDILNLLKKLREQRQLTMLLIEHRIEEAAPLADRVLIMDRGTIALDAPAQSAWHRLEEFRVRGLMVPTLPALFESLGRSERPLETDKAARILGEVESLSKTQQSFSHTSPRRSPPPLLTVTSLSFRYTRSSSEVLHNVTFTVDRGESVALMGSNGSGKSTLLSCIAGILRPEQGQIRVKGHVIRGPAIDIGLMFQDPDLMLLSDTVLEEIRFAPYHHHFDPALMSESVEEAVSHLKLEPFLNEPPLALSRGQRLRVAVASVLSARPGVLLLDEPTTGQDRLHVETLMDGLSKQTGLDALLFCTHDVGTALKHATRAIVLSEGRVIADGPPREILSDAESCESGGLMLPPARELALALGLDAFTLEELQAALTGGVHE